jgi:hypothetical protein
MKHQARERLLAAGIDFGPSKINRKFVEFRKRQPGGDLTAFLRFLADSILTSAERKRTRWLLDSDNTRVVSYADPTGEHAVKNILRQQRGR